MQALSPLLHSYLFASAHTAEYFHANLGIALRYAFCLDGNMTERSLLVASLGAEL
jgi:hypothetical protein